MEAKWLDRTLGVRVGVIVKRIWVTLPSYRWWGRVILWWRVIVMESVDVFNVRRRIVTLNEV